MWNVEIPTKYEKTIRILLMAEFKAVRYYDS